METSTTNTITDETVKEPEKKNLHGFWKAASRILWIAISNIYVIPCHLVLLVLLLPLKHMNTELYWNVEGILYEWMLSMAGSWQWSAGYTISEVGDDIAQYTGDSCLLVPNHQSTGDVPTLMYALSNKGILRHLVWIMDFIFQYTNFGWVSKIHGDFFIQQGKHYRDKMLELMKIHFHTIYRQRDRKWIILFPEGGFLRKRRHISQQFAKKHDYPVLQHVTLPRIGAMQTLLKELTEVTKVNGEGDAPPHQEYSNNLKWVIDVTIGYPDNIPLNVHSISSGSREPCNTTLLYRVYPISEVPMETEELTKWMYERYVEKEKFLEVFYQTGHFPQEHPQTNGHKKHFVSNARPVSYDWFWLIFLQILFAIITYMEYCLLSPVFSVIYSFVTFVFSFC